MANKIKLKRTSVSGREPTDLEVGEIALNMADKKILFKDHNSVIQEISGGGGSASGTVSSTPNTLVLRDASGDINARIATIDNEVRIGTGGSDTDPAITFEGDGDTGIWRNSGNQMRFVAGGSHVLTMTSGFTEFSKPLNLGDTGTINFDIDSGSTTKIKGKNGGLEIHSDNEVNFYESDGNALAIQMTLNDKSMDVKGYIKEAGTKLTDKYASKTHTHSKISYDSNSYVEAQDTRTRIQTNSGYLEVGPMNTGWCHLQTDRAKFYLNKKLEVDGSIGVYGKDSTVIDTNGKIKASSIINVPATWTTWFDVQGLTSADNLDTVLTDGSYKWAGSKPTNNPFGGYSNMFVQHDGGQASQMVWGGSETDSQFAIRRRTSGTWNAWVKFANANHQHDSRYVRLTAPILTGSLSKLEDADGVQLSWAKSSNSVDFYEVWSSVTETDEYVLIGKVLSSDVSTSTVEMTDDGYDTSSTTIYYKVYAVHDGQYSNALSASITVSNTASDPTNLITVPVTGAYMIQYDLPNDPKLTNVTIKKYASTTEAGANNEGSATVIYTGERDTFVYEVPSADSAKYHKFWVSSNTRI